MPASYPFPSFFYGATDPVANAGNSVDTLQPGQCVLFDRNMNPITLTGGVPNSSALDLSTLHVAMCKPNGEPVVSVGIPVADILLPLSYEKYSPFVGQTFTIDDALLQAVANPATVGDTATFLTLRLMRDDNFTPSVGGARWTLTSEYLNTADGRRKSLNDFYTQAKKNDYVSATVTTQDAGTWAVTIKMAPPKYEEVGSIITPNARLFASVEYGGTGLYQSLPNGREILSSTTFAKGSGLGIYVAEMEQALDLRQAANRYLPFPAGFNGGINKGGYYNLIGIRFRVNYLGDMLTTQQRELSVAVAFETDANGTVGDQEQKFKDALLAAIPKAHNLMDTDTTDLIEQGNANNPGGTGDNDQ